MQQITPCLWFKNEAEQAASFYVSLFNNSKIGTTCYYNEEIAEVAGMPIGSVLTVDFQLEGQDFIAVNGNHDSPFTPAMSFFVACETSDEMDQLWQKLADNGNVLMPLDKYPFSEKYGWLEDKFGVSWQLILKKRKQKIAACLLFVGKQAGKAEEAMNLYTSLFPNSGITSLERYDAGPDTGKVKHAIFTLNGQEFSAMDSGMSEHTFTFTMATSLMVTCETQEEVDYFWAQLSKGGEKSECGWLTDPYGVTWQVTPTILLEWLREPNLQKWSRAMKVLMPMQKIDIETLKQAAEGTLEVKR